MSAIWMLELSCCGRENGTMTFATYEDAEAFRESYTSGPSVNPHGYSGDGHCGHQRSAILSQPLEFHSPCRDCTAEDCGCIRARAKEGNGDG